VERALAWVLALVVVTAAVAAQAEERLEPEPWEVSYPDWSGNIYFDPGGRVVVKVNVSFLEPGAYTASFHLFAYREQGLVAGIPVVQSLLGSAELPPDVYSGTVTLTIEAVVPDDVACGAPVTVEGYVAGFSPNSYAVVGGKERPFVAYYSFNLVSACALTVQDALKVYRELGGKEGLSKLNAQLENLQSEKAKLERSLASTQAELEKLAAEKAALKEELNAAKAENARLNATAAQLNQQLLGLTAEKQLLMFTVTTLTILLTGTAAVLLAVLLLYAKERKK